MNSFIKACEIWTPSKDRSMLEFSAGLFGNATAFAAQSRAMCFGRDEGLPGRAWESGHPIMLTQLSGGYFRRAAAAAAADIHCAVALPIFLFDTLTCVLVFFCGASHQGAGALELWHNDPRVSTDMSLVDGHFGAGGEALEALARDTYLPRGTGLAGLAWQQGAAVLIDDLGQSTRFLRGDSTDAIGIKRGLAIPCSALNEHHYTLNFLSASLAPIAHTIESWGAVAEGSGLQRLFGFSESQGALPAGDDGPTLALESDSCIVAAFKTGIAQVADLPGAGESVSLIAIPVIADGQVNEVVTLYL